MASLKDLRNRISSVKATQKITKAMQMVAAAKLRRTQQAAEANRAYSQHMERTLKRLSKLADMETGAPALLAGTGRDNKTHLLVVASAERGLCGAFNTNIARKVANVAAELLENGREVKFFCIGSKAHDILQRVYKERIVQLIDLRSAKNIEFQHAEEIGKIIVKMFEDDEFDTCQLFFSEFRSVLLQKPTSLQLIPVKLPKDESGKDDDPRTNGAIYKYEPDEEEILRDLLPRNVYVQIYQALLENAASEQGARMTSMDNATRNAGDMIDNLTLQYNRSRQAQITNELIEIISGAEAL
jgi:F-type H+-transporting ATPase subunit gamma